MIHIATPSGEQLQYQEAEAHQYYREGRFAPGTLYWREGMAEWRPIAEFIPAGTPAVPTHGYRAPASVGASSSRYTFVKDPKALTMVLLAFLGFSLGLDLIGMVFDALEYNMLCRDFTEDEAIMNDWRQGLFALTYIGLYLITVIIFSMWLYRANKNSRGFGAQDMKFTPGWAVGYYFIPFVCIWKPYQSMKEMWQISKDPDNWKFQPATLVGIWWAFWLITNAMGRIIFRISMNAETIEEFKHAAVVSGFGAIPSVILTILAFILVRKLYQQQTKLVQG